MANSSFLPEDYLENKLQRRINLISLTLFVVVMGAVVGTFLYSNRLGSDVQQLQHDVNAQFEEAARRLEQLAQLQQRKKRMIRKAHITASLLECVPRSLVLSELVNAMPPTLGLLELHLTSKKLNVAVARPRTRLEAEQAKRDRKRAEIAAPPVDATRVTIQLVGAAPTDVHISEFMTNLGQNKLFADLNFIYVESKTIDSQLLRKFSIEMTLNQDLDIQQFEPKLVRRELKDNPMGNKIWIRADGATVLSRRHVLPVGDGPEGP